MSGRSPAVVYLAQLTHGAGDRLQNRHFPLAVGNIACVLKERFGDSVEVELFKTPADLDAALASRMPDALMLGAYMWNTRLSLAFARRVKAVAPDVLVVFGGPNVSVDGAKQEAFLRGNPCVDLWVLYEGEETAARVVEAFLATGSPEGTRRARIPATIAVADGEFVRGDAERARRIGLGAEAEGLDAIPSPYQSGMLDKFFRKNMIPLLESNRGCPFRCSFCQQGNGYFNRVCNHSRERFREDLRYVARRIRETGAGIDILEVADSNFGMYERDAGIIADIARCQDEFDYPLSIWSSTGKNHVDRIVRNTSVLREGSISLRCAVQSLNPPTLEAIRRANIRSESYREIMRELLARKLRSNADVMLGLPDETLESHVRAVFELIDMGIHEFSLLQTVILNGTEMEMDDYRKRYGIETATRVIPECYGEYGILGEPTPVYETEEIIVRTATMPFEDYLRARRLHLLVMIFHNTQLLAPVYRYLEGRGIARSEVVKAMHLGGGDAVRSLTDDFIADTEGELVDPAAGPLAAEALDRLTHNKIFKHLTVAFYRRKERVLDALDEALRALPGPVSGEDIAGLRAITGAMMISGGISPDRVGVPVQGDGLRRVFGDSVSLAPTPPQLAAFRLLDGIYTDPEDKINKMVYHLRPANLCLAIE